MLNKRAILAVFVPMAATIAAASPALARDGAFVAPPQPPITVVNPGGTDLATKTAPTTVSQPSAALGTCLRITIAWPSPWALFADRGPTRLLPPQPDRVGEDRCVVVTLAPAPASHPAPMPKPTMVPPVENQGPGSGAYTPNPGPITSTTTTAPTTPPAPVENQGPGSGAYTPNPGPITSTTTTAPTTPPAPVENQGPGSGAYTPNPGPITSTTTTAPTTTTTPTQNTTTLPDGQVVATGTHW